MKFRFLVKVIETMLGKDYEGCDQRPDMYLPNWLYAMALVLIVFGAGGVVCGILFDISVVFASGIVAVATGILAYLCWKNQSIIMISEDEFEYTTFLGNKKRYYFRDITGMKKNNDSWTLFVSQQKVHMEACAIISDRLVERINSELDKII